jgi:hypothetical protein
MLAWFQLLPILHFQYLYMQRLVFTTFVYLSLVSIYGRNSRKNRATIFLNGQFIIVYTCKPHINHKYSLVLITPLSFKMLYFGWREWSWLNLYDHMETRLGIIHCLLHAEAILQRIMPRWYSN